MPGQPLYLKDVATLKLDGEKCVGCGMCLTVCPHEVFRMDNGKAHIQTRDACMECGACATNCPAGAIGVERGVGCATAVINSALGRSRSSCCCVLDPREAGSDPEPGRGIPRSGCC